MDDVDVVVVGAGVAGLTVAHSLAGRRPLVLEASPVPGGYLAPGELAGVPVDVGAESYAVRSTAVAELVAELGLEPVTPSSLSAWGYVPDRSGMGGRGGAGRAFPLPGTGVLGIPGLPWAADTRRAIGVLGALRASLDTVLPASRVDTSDLAAFVRSRLGRRVLDRLVTPVAGGVHSSDPALLSVDSVAPGLRAAYERTGSLTAAVRSLRAQAPAGSAVRGIAGGLHGLVSALARSVVEQGGEVRLSTPVERVERDGVGWVVRTADGSQVRARAVVVATTGRAATRLLDGLVDVEGAEPARGTDIRLVTLLLRTPALDAAPRGTGLLVAPGSGVGAKASTHATAKWPWLRQIVTDTLGADAHVVRLSYGRGGGLDEDDVRGATDDALVARALRDVEALYGIDVAGPAVEGSVVTRWDDALPPPTPAVRERAARLTSDVAEVPGLEVTGAWVAGTGLAAVVPHARSVAQSVENALK
ncbi:protoporphyrinogen oxidase [Sanguibacter sp. YZGR15]|uniref:Coproporphyrinogen III oxidase n=1 Tax=Sanguibacter suaedae TaxID=2795737 RepID=A0A934IBL8_9MICO|nr:protoporphyrinogen oxidase [Sanguibacter suaedae]